MSERTLRRKLKYLNGYLYQIRKVRGEDNLYRLYNLSIGAYRGGGEGYYYTFEELVEIAKSYDED